MQCSVEGCENKRLAKGICNRHYKIRAKYGSEHYPVKKLAKKGTGVINAGGYRVHGKNHERTYEHVTVAERVLGKPLPPGAIVHHVDGNPANNAPSNLVICPDQAYHLLLHVRQRAIEACGNPNYRKCMVCKRWDDPKNMKWAHSTTYYHKPASLCKGV